MREGLAAMLTTQQDMQVVAEADTGSKAIAMAEVHRPDVILMDLQLPDMDGSEAIARIKADWPAARFLVLTSYDTDDRVLRAIRAGAQGYLLKGVPKDELFQVVRAICQGNSLLGPGIAPKLLQVYHQAELPAASDLDRLSQRELKILRLVSDGERNKEIAAQLDISERMVKFHINSIFQKLGASSRTEAVKLAAQKGLIHI
jgi:two-component system, NarL family, response regulator LiaR